MTTADQLLPTASSMSTTFPRPKLWLTSCCTWMTPHMTRTWRGSENRLAVSSSIPTSGAACVPCCTRRAPRPSLTVTRTCSRGGQAGPVTRTSAGSRDGGKECRTFSSLQKHIKRCPIPVQTTRNQKKIFPHSILLLLHCESAFKLSALHRASTHTHSLTA